MTNATAAKTPIEVKNLRKVYRSVTAVDNITFSITKGSVTALLGGNGAGKTTTISILLGLVLPTSGEVSVLGADITKDRHLVLHRMNFESPYVDMPMRLTVWQNLNVYAQLYGLKTPGDRIEEIAIDFQLQDLLHRPVGKLSAGQKTRVSLAKALLNRPELLLLDEPTASLDPDTADWVRTKLDLYRGGEAATILLASHNMPEVERLADRVIMLDQGRIIEDDTPSVLIDRYGRSSLEQVFLDIARHRDKGAGKVDSVSTAKGFQSAGEET